MSKRPFISHSCSYSERYNSMFGLRKNWGYFTWTNFSAPEDKAISRMTIAQLKEQLRNQIKPVNFAIIIGGMWTAYSNWIQFEMEFAESIGKPILDV